MNTDTQFAPVGPKRNDVDSIYAAMSEDMGNSPTNINKKVKYSLKSGDKFAAKNDMKAIQNGKPRYILQDNAFYFLREPELYEAKRFFEAQKIKCVKEEIY